MINHRENTESKDNQELHATAQLGALAPENGLAAPGEKNAGGVGVSAPASTAGVAIYSGEAPEKKSTASGGRKNAMAGAPVSVEETMRRLWEADGTVTREDALMAAASRLHDAARCFAQCGMKQAGKLLYEQAVFAIKSARAARLTRELQEADGRLSSGKVPA